MRPERRRRPAAGRRARLKVTLTYEFHPFTPVRIDFFGVALGFPSATLERSSVRSRSPTSTLTVRQNPAVADKARPPVDGPGARRIRPRRPDLLPASLRDHRRRAGSSLFYETLNNATREGARYAIVNGANTSCPSGPPAPGDTAPLGATTFGRQREGRGSEIGAFGVLGQGVDVAAGAGPTSGNSARGMTVTVDADYTYHTACPTRPLPSITITAESSLVINN